MNGFFLATWGGAAFFRRGAAGCVTDSLNASPRPFLP